MATKQEDKLTTSATPVNSTAPLPIGPLFRDPDVMLQTLLYERLARAGYPDIRPAHGCVFGNIAPEGSTVTELARLAQLTKATVVAAVDDLEQLGYVERVPDPTDRRAKTVRLTPRGSKAISAGNGIFDEIEAEWGALVGADTMRELRTLLERLHAALVDRLQVPA